MGQTGTRDLFPSTHGTWLDTRIDLVLADDVAVAATAAREMRQHVMERYCEPLAAYARGSSMRTLGEPDEIVHSFFAKVLGDPHFLVRWRARGGPLRRWMMNGMLLHARGIVRDRARARERSSLDAATLDAALSSPERGAQEAFESAWAMTMLDEACREVQDAFDDDGRAQAFEIFRRHVIDGKSYPVIAADLGVDAVRCATEVRAVTRALREALVGRLRDDGIGGEVVEAEVRAILRRIGQE